MKGTGGFVASVQASSLVRLRGSLEKRDRAWRRGAAWPERAGERSVVRGPARAGAKQAGFPHEAHAHWFSVARHSQPGPEREPRWEGAQKELPNHPGGWQEGKSIHGATPAILAGVQNEREWDGAPSALELEPQPDSKSSREPRRGGMSRVQPRGPTPQKLVLTHGSEVARTTRAQQAPKWRTGCIGRWLLENAKPANVV